MIVNSAVHLHQALSPGLLESVYDVTLARPLEKRGYLLNFGDALMKDGITPTINGEL